MDNITITFLGTGNAIPTKLRNHTAILLSYKSENILIDCGEGTQRQFKILGISPTKLTKILVTHWHGDHTLGIPGLFQTLSMSNYQKNLEVFGPKGSKQFMSFLSPLIKSYDPIKYSIKEVQSGRIIDFPDFCIETLPMSHGIPSQAYSFIIKDKLRLNKEKIKKLKLPNSPLLKKLSQGKDIVFNNKKIRSSQVCYLEKGKKATIILDTLFNQNAVKLAKNSDVLICESSFLSDIEQQAKEHKHLTAKQSAQIAKLSKSKALYLTHISERYEPDFSLIEKEAKSVFNNTKVAKDFDKIEI